MNVPQYNTRIEQVDVAQVYDLRHRILRVDMAREAAYFAGDDEPTAMHLATRDEHGRIIACVTLIQRDYEDMNNGQRVPGWQLRGMAVDGAWQSRGIGSVLLHEAVRRIKAKEDGRQLWCNARVPAMRFYQRHGWRVVSQPFEIPTAGPHVRMVRD